MLEELKNLLRKADFEPFRLVLLNGQQFDVDNPTMLVIYEYARYAFFAERAGQWAMFPLSAICTLQSLIDF